MNKKITLSKSLKDLREDAKNHLPEHTKYLNERLDIIETALEEKEKQDQIIKIIKEIIQFNTLQPEIKRNEDGTIQGMIGGVYMELQREIENKERKLFREWVLETCFPKELKALEIIKNNFIPYDIETLENGKIRIWLGVNRFVDLTQEEYDLLKGMLL